MTVTNMNVMKNYSNWNLVVLHPNLESLTQVFSFNYRALDQYGYISKLETKPFCYYCVNFYYSKEISSADEDAF